MSENLINEIDADTLFINLQEEGDKWKRRAKRFCQAYRDKQVEILSHEIQRMAIEADGGINPYLQKVANGCRAKMLSACIERNEVKEELASVTAERDRYRLTVQEIGRINELIGGTEEAGLLIATLVRDALRNDTDRPSDYSE